MRLIDADALLKSHCISLDGEYESCKECLEPPYGCCCLEVKGEDIYNAPTIPAIPVEWLDAQIRGYASALKSTELKALMLVKQMWEEEQEAR